MDFLFLFENYFLLFEKMGFVIDQMGQNQIVVREVPALIQNKNMETELIGTWISDMNDLATKNNIGNVRMTFTIDGKLIYEIHEAKKLQKMFMIYRINGDTIISDQPSEKTEQITKFKFINKDRLILEFEGLKTFYNRRLTD